MQPLLDGRVRAMAHNIDPNYEPDWGDLYDFDGNGYGEENVVATPWPPVGVEAPENSETLGWEEL